MKPRDTMVNKESTNRSVENKKSEKDAKFAKDDGQADYNDSTLKTFGHENKAENN